MTDVLADEPVLLALIVVGLGAAIGAVRVRGLSLGPAAALLVGLAAGAVDDSLSGAAGLEMLRELGLVLFVYTVGLASGPSFANGVRRGGAAAITSTVVLVAGLGAASAGLAALLDLSPADRAGQLPVGDQDPPEVDRAAIERQVNVAALPGLPCERLHGRLGADHHDDVAGVETLLFGRHPHRAVVPDP